MPTKLKLAQYNPENGGSYFTIFVTGTFVRNLYPTPQHESVAWNGTAQLYTAGKRKILTYHNGNSSEIAYEISENEFRKLISAAENGIQGNAMMEMISPILEL